MVLFHALKDASPGSTDMPSPRPLKAKAMYLNRGAAAVRCNRDASTGNSIVFELNGATEKKSTNRSLVLRSNTNVAASPLTAPAVTAPKSKLNTWNCSPAWFSSRMSYSYGAALVYRPRAFNAKMTAFSVADRSNDCTPAARKSQG